MKRTAVLGFHGSLYKLMHQRSRAHGCDLSVVWPWWANNMHFHLPLAFALPNPPLVFHGLACGCITEHPGKSGLYTVGLSLAAVVGPSATLHDRAPSCKSCNSADRHTHIACNLRSSVTAKFHMKSHKVPCSIAVYNRVLRFCLFYVGDLVLPPMPLLTLSAQLYLLTPRAIRNPARGSS